MPCRMTIQASQLLYVASPALSATSPEAVAKNSIRTSQRTGPFTLQIFLTKSSVESVVVLLLFLFFFLYLALFLAHSIWFFASILDQCIPSQLRSSQPWLASCFSPCPILLFHGLHGPAIRSSVSQSNL